MAYLIPTITIPEYQTHKLAIKGKTATYQVTILENSKTIMSDCSCGKHKCFHVMQVLAGVQNNMVSAADADTQQKILASLKTSPLGREKIIKAAKLVGINDSCPICGSSKTKRLKSFSFRSVLFKTAPQKIVAECLDCNERW